MVINEVYITVSCRKEKSSFNNPSVCTEAYKHGTQGSGWESRTIKNYGFVYLKRNGTYFFI
jgi:hypothetical protein